MVSLFSTNITKGSVVCDILGDVGNLMDGMVVLKNLWINQNKFRF